MFQTILVHTKGRWARRPFTLAAWQREIIDPVFGDVEWSPEFERFVRTYRMAWVELARKNGKSELLAGIALVLLVADDEEGAEVYGCARDRDQARKVYDVAERMVELCPTLAKRLGVYKQAKRIVDKRTGSYYTVVAADAAGNLGHNPHGIIFDEVITQPSADLWNAMRTAMGAREQPLMIAATTAGSDMQSFARTEHDYSEMIDRKAARDPRRFVYMRNTPMHLDWRDERSWSFANPALGQFLSLDALRDECREAVTSPIKEQAFRQFRLNQWVRAETRWMPIELYDLSAGLVDETQLVGRQCYGGLDLAAVSDLTSLAWWFPPQADDEAGVCIWRHFVPEAIVATLDECTAGEFSQWARAGFVTITDGDVADYDVVHERIADDVRTFAPVVLGIDRWNSTGTTNWLAEHVPKLDVELVAQTFGGLSAPMKEIMRLVRTARFAHGGNPVARWCFASVEVRQDENENVRPIKPDRQRHRYRIDAVLSATMALDGAMRRPVVRRYRAAGF